LLLSYITKEFVFTIVEGDWLVNKGIGFRVEQEAVETNKRALATFEEQAHT
jgi:hypothetical protein